MARYFIRLSYCGTAYNGWQNQPHAGTITIQQTIEQVLSTLLRKKAEITGCGRTDTGVHARDYYAHFDCNDIIEIPFLIYRMNKMLPEDIAVHDIISVHETAHARFDAVSRSYEYHLHTSKSPFLPYSYYYTYAQPDLSILNQVASVLMEYDDFTSFCKSNTDVHTKQCIITKCCWKSHNDRFVFEIMANRFLRGMIRLIVGVSLNISRNKISIDTLRQALDQKQRLPYDWSVPAEGLILCHIKYPYL